MHPDLYILIVLRRGLGLYIKSKGQMLPGRGWTLTAMLRKATDYTGTRYPRSMRGAEQAEAALAALVDRVKAAVTA